VLAGLEQSFHNILILDLGLRIAFAELGLLALFLLNFLEEFLFVVELECRVAEGTVLDLVAVERLDAGEADLVLAGAQGYWHSLLSVV
jgi:hypothetical protein